MNAAKIKKHSSSTAREIVCRCNNIPRCDIEKAIIDGAKSDNEIYDATGAGVGPCGGTCRYVTQPMLDQYLKTGTFPEKTPLRPKGK